MVDKPDIVKKLEEEELGKLESSSQGSHEELEIPEELPKNTSDESTEFFNEEFENGAFNTELTQHDSSSGDSSFDGKELLFQSTSDLMLYLDKHGKISKINKAGIAFSGFSEDEVIGQFFWKLSGVFSKYNLSKYLKVFKNILKGKPTENFLCELHDGSGKKHIMDFSTYPIKENEKLASILVVAKDVTEQKETEDKYRLITESSLDTIFALTKTGKIAYVSPSSKELFGFEPNEMIGTSFIKYIINAEQPKCWKALKDVIFYKKILGFETYVKHRNGSLISIEINGQTVEWDGELVAQGTIRDITKRKQVESELQMERDKLTAIFGSMEDGVYIVNKNHDIQYVNPVLKKDFGSPEGKKCHEYFHNSDEPCTFCKNEDVFAGKTVHWEWTSPKNGKTYDLIDTPLKNTDGSISKLEIFRDITKYKQVEKALLEANNIINRSPAVAFLWKNEEGWPVEFVSENVEKLSGYSAQEFLARKISYSQIIHSNDLERVAGEVANCSEKEGLQTLVHEPYRIITKNGDIKWVDDITNIRRDSRGIITHYEGIVYDITGRKKAERELKDAHELLKKMNDELENKVAERTDEIKNLLKQKDEFIGQLGHDLKNPLGPLINLIPLLEKTETDSESKKILEVLHRNVNHMKNLVVDTIVLGRLNSPNVKFNIENTNLLDELNNVIERNILLYKENNIEIENKTGKNVIVKTDKLRLAELFDNLIGNSVKYSPDGGTITIDVKQDTDFVTVSIKDTGIGITEEQLSHIFDEFYKADFARHDFDSSGLGLPICKRIVEKQGGKIWVESPGIGKGSTFYFTLKTVDNNPESFQKTGTSGK